MKIDLPIFITGIIEKWCDEIEVLFSNFWSQSKWVSELLFLQVVKAKSKKKKIHECENHASAIWALPTRKNICSRYLQPHNDMTLQIANCNWKKIMPQLKKKDFPIPRGEGNQSKHFSAKVIN